MTVYTVAALYKFAPLDDCAALREPLRAECEAAGVKGTLLLAAEGINGTIAGPAAGIDHVLAYLRRDPRLADLEAKFSTAADMPFYRLKIRLKKEIVTIGVPEVDPNEVVGTYVKPEDWNALISDPDVVLIDTRNDYEVAIGTFKGAVNPNTKTFREFPDWVAQSSALGNKPKVAMFCTGGIRCEKASAYMKAQGFDEVYHLQGGILKYLETVPAEASLWEGECFVFDQRVAVGHGLAAGSYDICHACRRPVSGADKASPLYVEGVSCPHCHDALTLEKRQRFEARQHQMDLARARNNAHIGVPTEVQKRARLETE